MKRPAFQFYPADWRNNAKLRRCSPAARGAWIDVLCLLHDSDEYGVLRWPLAEIARAAGVPLKLLRELSDKNVLKGADRDAPGYSFAPTHAGKRGNFVILVSQSEGPCWYCTRFVRDEYIRQKRGLSSRFDADNQPPKPQPIPPFGDGEGDGLTSTSTSSKSNTSMEDGSDIPPSDGKNPTDPPPPIEPATAAAVALNRAGVRCSGMHPGLIELMAAGATVAMFESAAKKFPGYNIGYLISVVKTDLQKQSQGVNPNGQTNQRRQCVVDRTVANSAAWLDDQRNDDDRVVKTFPRLVS